MTVPIPQTPPDHNVPRLGALLVERGVITSEQLAAALEQQQQTGQRLGEAVIELGFTSPHTIALALASQHGGILKTEYGV